MLIAAMLLVGPGAHAAPNHGIVGGDVVLDGQWPEVVALVDRSSGTDAFCTGTLIAETTVLTAAHCVDDLAGVELAIATGIQAEDAPYDVVLSTSVVIHPSWKGVVGVGRDIALVHLERAPLAPFIASLNSAPMHDAWLGDQVDLVGYGVTRDEGTDGGVKRHATSAIYDLDGDQIATFDGTHQICFGDSGGPTFVDQGGGRVQIGVHSYISDGCADGVGWDDRVDTAIDWIQAQGVAIQTRPAGPPDFSCSHAWSGENHALGVVPFELKCVVHAPDPMAVLDIRWTWGDGATSEGLSASHVYTETGTHFVTLCADLQGETEPWTWCISGRQQVTACGKPAIAFDGRPGVDPLTIEIDNHSDVADYGCLTEVEWTVYRGSRAEGEPVRRVRAWQPTIDVTEPGDWTIVLTAGGYGGTAAALSTIRVPGRASVACGSQPGTVGLFAVLPLLLGLRRRD